jgi:hypothetical protein
MNHSRLTIIVLSFLLTAASICTAATPQSGKVYRQTVQPFLKTHCLKSHDARKAQAGLRLDRLGVALLFDPTQIERTLAVAERIAARAIVDKQPLQGLQRYEFEENPRVSKFRSQAKSRFAETLVEVGPSGFEFINGGVRFVHGYGNRPKGNSWGRLGGTTFDNVITQNGYYRIRILAGASRGSRGEPINVQALYTERMPTN